MQEICEIWIWFNQNSLATGFIEQRGIRKLEGVICAYIQISFGAMSVQPVQHVCNEQILSAL